MDILNTRDDEELEEAKDAYKIKSLVLACVGDEVKDKMIGGEAALTVVWSGDTVYMRKLCLEYVVPKKAQIYGLTPLLFRRPARTRRRQNYL